MSGDGEGRLADGAEPEEPRDDDDDTALPPEGDDPMDGPAPSS